MIDVPTPAPRRTDRKVCPTCEAAPRACDTNHWLRGRFCCEACTGNHDAEVS